MIKKEDRPEFIGQIIDIFEDTCEYEVYFCDKKYDNVKTALEELMKNWKIFND